MINKKINFNGKTYEAPEIPVNLANSILSGLNMLQSTNASPISKLNKIYQLINEYNQFVKTFTVCSADCSHCCKINIVISSLEAAYIEKNIDLKYDNGSNITKNHTTPCPFLINDNCSIYAYRPFACRSFHTVDDPKYCSQKINHVVFGSADEGYNSDIYRMLKGELNNLNQYKSWRDIRDFFPE